MTDLLGQRALWRRFALEGAFGARRASCGWFGVGHGTGGGEKEPLSLPRAPVRRERVGLRRYLMHKVVPRSLNRSRAVCYDKNLIHVCDYDQPVL